MISSEVLQSAIAASAPPDWLPETRQGLGLSPDAPAGEAPSSLGAVIARAFGWDEAEAQGDELKALGDAAKAIADHYGLSLADCIGAMFELERETMEASGLLWLLHCPHKSATLGRRVAEKILGPDALARAPLALGGQ